MSKSKSTNAKVIDDGAAAELLRALVRLLARQAAREILSPHLQKETHDVDGKV